MDLCSKKAIKFWLKKYGLQPSKRLGQNFLIDKSVLKKIIEAADLKPENVVLEIGPGIGTLTQELGRAVSTAQPGEAGGLASPGEAGGRIIAVEKDAKMAEILKETLKDYKNIEIIHDDILKLNLESLSLSHETHDRAFRETDSKKYKVVANLPYNIASAIIRKFLETENPPSEMVLMVQKEVSQRICAKPPRMNLLAVSVQFYADAKIISYISKKSFWPSPKVDSAIIKIENIISAAHQRRKSAFNQRFFKIVKAGFSQPRKQLINNLSSLAAPTIASPDEADGWQEEQGKKGGKGKEEVKEKIRVWLLKNNIQPTQRAETLSVNDWINLTNTFK